MQLLQRARKTPHGLLALALTALLAIAACSKDKNIDEPAKLTPLPHPSVQVKHLWGHNMGDKKAARITPAT